VIVNLLARFELCLVSVPARAGNNPNLPSSGTVSITILSNGITVGGNGYYVKGPASC
jgi:hypothetical protein